MIAKISHISNPSSFQSKIDYNEKKVEKGVAKLFFDNTFSTSRDDRIGAFNEVISLNKKVRNAFAFEVSINLPQGEQLKDEDFKSLALEYIKELGYENAPVVAYRHNDKLHNHLHLYISKLDWEGKRINDSHQFKKSQSISRSLETKYNLQPTLYNTSVTIESLGVMNARKYYIQNALKKGLKSFSSKEGLYALLNEKQIKLITSKALDNQQIGVVLGGRTDQVMLHLDKHHFFNKLFKDELYKKVDNILSLSSTTDEYIANIEREGIYIRKIYDRATPQYIYGLEDVSFYIEDKKLGTKFTYAAITGKPLWDERVNSEKRVVGIDKQKQFIKTQIVHSLDKSRTIKDLREHLQKRGVELITYQNSGGIYGVAFKSIKLEEQAEVIKGSDVGISWTVIEQKLELNSGIVVTESYQDIQEQENTDSFEMPDYVPEKNIQNKKDQEDYQTIRRKKKRGRSR